MAVQQFERLPALFPLYLRALLSGGAAGELADATIHGSGASIGGLTVDPRRLERFRQLVGYPDDGMLPPTFPQALAAPLHLSLLTAKDFPLRVTGLVHLSNRISSIEAIPCDRALDLDVAVGPATQTSRGVELSLETAVSIDGRCCWRAVGLLLSRIPGKRQGSNAAARRSSPASREIDRWHAEQNIGRRYAAVSGDYNPIHLHPLTARLFGFRAPIAHGMWSLARSLTGLHSVLRPPFEINVEFVRPMLLPAVVRLLHDDDSQTFSVVHEQTNKAYLCGSIA